ncbi:MAG: fluoride efflux transporter FluC [Anaerovoracaceae bacterium]|jgi:CrcB protein
MINCLLVGAGGFIGAIARYLITLIQLPGRYNLFPATFITNFAGAFAIGYLVTLVLIKEDIDPRLILFLKVGVCGGFTTFSTLALETTNIMEHSHFLLGVAYLAVSAAAGIAAVFLGGRLALSWPA